MNKAKIIILAFLSWELHAAEPVELSLALKDTRDQIESGHRIKRELDVFFDNFRLQLFLKYNEPFLTIVLRDPLKKSSIDYMSPDWLDDCLFFVADLSNSSAELELVNAKPKGCGLPKAKKGTFLMGLSEALIRNLDIKNTTLIDISDIECEESGESAKLSLLRIMQNKNTWYENFGYRPIDADDFKKAILVLKDIGLLDLRPEIERSIKIITEKAQSESKYERRPYDAYIKAYKMRMKSLVKSLKEFSEISASKKISDYLAWLWSKDCSEYIKVTELIFPPFLAEWPSSREGVKNAPSWWPSYSKFLSGLNQMIKEKYSTCPMCGY